MLPKSAIVATDFQKNYISLVKEEEIGKALEHNAQQFKKLLKKIPRKKHDYAYAEGKWTLREVLQHVIDAERVFTYRALRLGRLDSTPLAGFDENSWAVHSNAGSRKWDDLVEEFKAVRKSTQFLFASLNDEQLAFAGESNGNPLNALGIGFLIPGHLTHHINIIKERYL